MICIISLSKEGWDLYCPNSIVGVSLEQSLLLTKLFDFEDIYLKNHSIDFIFGVYQKKITQNIYNVED